MKVALKVASSAVKRAALMAEQRAVWKVDLMAEMVVAYLVVKLVA